MISATKEVEISYAHKLPDHKGECKHLHGHNAKIEIEVGMEEKELPESGMVVDFADIKEILSEYITGVLDHRYMNDVLPGKYLPPTAENIILWIKDELLRVYGFSLLRVRLYETERNWAEWKK